MCIKSSRRPLGRRMSFAGSVFRPKLLALVPREFISSETPLQLQLSSGQAFPRERSKQAGPFLPAVVHEDRYKSNRRLLKKVRPEELLPCAMPLPDGAKDIRRPKQLVASGIASQEHAQASPPFPALPSHHHHHHHHHSSYRPPESDAVRMANIR